jgi:uncharacterized protein
MTSAPYIAFNGNDRVAVGALAEVVRAAKAVHDRRQASPILIFDGQTSSPVEVDFRGSTDDVLARLPGSHGTALEDAAPRGPGRPKLGVVAREVTLLPRHWEWLAQQSGGASVALRRLVNQARRDGEDGDRIRVAREAAYRFMAAMAGTQPRYEEALRALFADQASRFAELIAGWPADVRDHAAALAQRAFRRTPGNNGG